jgi:hypothetical protein
VDDISSSEPSKAFAKSVLENETVETFSRTVLEGVPAIMAALEIIMDIHPFLKGRNSNSPEHLY